MATIYFNSRIRYPKCKVSIKKEDGYSFAYLLKIDETHKKSHYYEEKEGNHLVVYFSFLLSPFSLSFFFFPTSLIGCSFFKKENLAFQLQLLNHLNGVLRNKWR